MGVTVLDHLNRKETRVMYANVSSICDDWCWYNIARSALPVPNVGVCRAEAISRIYWCCTPRMERSAVRAQRGVTGGSEFKKYFSI